MNQIVDQAIVLKRQEFGEADRIVTFLTRKSGKLTGMVKGARRSKSKMAGGIELFSQSSVTFMLGKGEMKTIISTRLETHYGNIAKDVTRTMWAYEALKFLDKATEEGCGPAYFDMAGKLLAALDDSNLPLDIVKLWFGVSLLIEMGHGINSDKNSVGGGLDAKDSFVFMFDTMSFAPVPNGPFLPAHIKFLRLAKNNLPVVLARVQKAPELARDLASVVEQCLKTWIR